jgi:tripartite-type tricarboxylate transporter receptor subunit TctC
MTNTTFLTRRHALQWAAAASASSALTVFGQSDWPQGKAVTFVVPFTAGSGTDVIARTIAEKLGSLLGAQIVIDNKTGAGGTVGAALVAKAPADGYTLLVHSSGHVVNPALYPKLSYDTLKDFDGITPLASLPNVIVVSPNKGYKDVADLVAKAKAQPGVLNYASAGNGSATHMNAEKFRVATGIQAQHVPYRGTPEALTETASGRIDWFFAPLVSALPLIQSGRLQALAVSTAQALTVIATSAFYFRGRLRKRGLHFLGRVVCDCQNPKAHREQIACGRDASIGNARCERALRKIRCSGHAYATRSF